jgi:hypothetical protein
MLLLIVFIPWIWHQIFPQEKIHKVSLLKGTCPVDLSWSQVLTVRDNTYYCYNWDGVEQWQWHRKNQFTFSRSMEKVNWPPLGVWRSVDYNISHQYLKQFPDSYVKSFDWNRSMDGLVRFSPSEEYVGILVPLQVPYMEVNLLRQGQLLWRHIIAIPRIPVALQKTIFDLLVDDNGRVYLYHPMIADSSLGLLRVEHGTVQSTHLQPEFSLLVNDLTFRQFVPSAWFPSVRNTTLSAATRSLGCRSVGMRVAFGGVTRVPAGLSAVFSG